MNYSRHFFRGCAALAACAILFTAYCSSPPPKKEPEPEVKKRSAPQPDPAEEKRRAEEARKRAAELKLAEEKRKEAERKRLQSELLASLGGQLKAMPVFYYPPFRHNLSEARFRRIFGSNLAVIKAIAGKVPPGFYLEVVGHANQHPKRSAEYTQELSQKRAQQVFDHLVSAGVPAAKMKAKGVSNSQPINADEPRNPKNRRVTFRIGVD